MSQPAWLRQHLPAHTEAYFRLPSPWGVVGAVPDGRPLDVVTAGKQNLQAIAQLREAIGNDKLIADSGAAPYVLPLLVDLRSPVEAAVVDPLGMMSPGSQALLTMRLAQRSPEAVNARFAALQTPALRLSKPLDASGNGMLIDKVPLHFDADSGRLFALLGKQGAQSAQLASLLADLGTPPDNKTHASFAAQEQLIDPSGEGLFGWVSTGGVGGIAAAAIPTQKTGTLPGDLISKTDAIAFGTGSVDGHGSMQLRIHAPQSPLLGYFAPRQFDPSFKVAGTPRWVANLALPDHAQWQESQKNLSLDFGAEKAQKIRQFLARRKDDLGFTAEELTQWTGADRLWR